MAYLHPQFFAFELCQQYFFLWVNENVCVQQEEGLVAIFLQIFQTSLLSTNPLFFIQYFWVNENVCVQQDEGLAGGDISSDISD